ncbi:MAG TPA: 4Fe-4S dicluster domain-containing protein [Clostridia bacterium]|nr:4Fe-4S dicluster domain-containing protein [Clostridia bacterium]
MFVVTIDSEKCEGCGECWENCPVDIISEGEDGKAVVDGDLDDCLGCETCVAVCENDAVMVEEM